MAAQTTSQVNKADELILEVKDLKTIFNTREGVVRAVNGISYNLHKGETLGIVGESGCGKSVGVLSLLRLIPEPPGKIAGGRALFMGRDLLRMNKEEIRLIRGNNIAMVFQDPMIYLNPVLTIRRQLTEALVLHMDMTRDQANKRAVELLDMVHIPAAESRIRDFPHQFSGGMRQRVMIAMALACNPKIIIADEPTTALDVTIQAQLVDLVKQLAKEMGTAIIWITHDLGVIAGMADRVAVMYSGYIVEEATTLELYGNPRHPYTIGLLASLPRVDDRDRKKAGLHRGHAARPGGPAAGLSLCGPLFLQGPALSGRKPPIPGDRTGPPGGLLGQRQHRERKMSRKEGQPLLRVTDLKKHFPIKKGILIKHQVGKVRAVDGVSFDIYPGETLGLVGESGCGKSTTGRTILQLYRPTAGEVIFKGINLAEKKGDELRRMRSRMQMLFQDPYASSNPRMTVGEIVGEPILVHEHMSRKDRYNRVRELLSLVGLNPNFINRYPPRVLRRTATADRHGQGPGPAPGLHRRRRTHLGPGRLHPGPGGQPAGGPPRTLRADLSPDRPRPEHGQAHQRPGGGDVSGQDRGAGRTGRTLRQPPAPLHPGPAFGRAHPRSHRRRPAAEDHHGGRCAQPGQPAPGMQLQHPLLEGPGYLQAGGTGIPGDRPGPLVRLPPGGLTGGP